MNKIARINVEMPVVPQSLMAFTETVVRDERAWLSLIESPLTALQSAGVPIASNSLTSSDIIRLVGVLGKLRQIVKSGKLAHDFRFEDVFGTRAEWRTQEGKNNMCSTRFDPKESCTESEHTEQRMNEKGSSLNFMAAIDQRQIWAPLLSPGDLAEIVARMDIKLRSMKLTLNDPKAIE